MNQKYSVLMSLYDKENPEYLGPSINSMLNQTVKPDEIVLVLDGPINDVLKSIVDDYVIKFPDIMKVVQLEDNIGLGLALNEGISQCRNNLIARMDTDDISYPSRIELQLIEFEKNPSLDIVGALTNEFYDSPDKVVSSRIVPEMHEEIVKFSKRRSPFNHPTVMYKKEAVVSAGGYRDILRNEDLDLFARMLSKGSKAKNIQHPLLYFRSNEDSYKRRKSWTNCKNYMSVIYNFWKNDYSSFADLAYVVVTQMGMFLSPTWLLKIISDNFLRESVVEEEIG